MVLKLKNSCLLVVLADADVLLEDGNADIGSALYTALLKEEKAAEGVIGALLNNKLINSDSCCVIIVEENELTVNCLVDVCLNAEVAAVAGSNESGVGILLLKTAAAAVSYHKGIAFIFEFDCIHDFASCKLLR